MKSLIKILDESEVYLYESFTKGGRNDYRKKVQEAKRKALAGVFDILRAQFRNYETWTPTTHN